MSKRFTGILLWKHLRRAALDAGGEMMNARTSGGYDQASKIATIARGAGTNRFPGCSWVMLNCVDLEPVFFAPFVSSVMRVEPSWIDYNGHLNMAYYNVLFDKGVDEMYQLAGIGEDYLKERRRSFFTAEVHIRYLRELHSGDPVRVTFQLLDFDSKRLHFFQQLFHAVDGWVSATAENLSLHVDMDRKKAAPFDKDVAKQLSRLKKSHGHLPRPEAAGRRIAMPD
jgi:acyl-CoA thioester hydrolase